MEVMESLPKVENNKEYLFDFGLYLGIARMF
jgi:hypothetical protein